MPSAWFSGDRRGSSDTAGILQLLHASHVRDRDEALQKGILAGGVWNAFLLGQARG